MKKKIPQSLENRASDIMHDVEDRTGEQTITDISISFVIELHSFGRGPVILLSNNFLRSKIMTEWIKGSRHYA